jgi:acyl dehydratase
MSEPLYFEDLNVGDCWASLARTVTQADVVNFAGMTGDYDPLHVDHEYASETPFGKPIAHGLLGLSWVAGLGSHSPSVRTLAFLRITKWEFVQPIYVGDTVHVKTEIVDKHLKGRRSGHVTWRRRLVNQADQVLQEGTFETLVSVAHVARRTREVTSSATAVAGSVSSNRAAG